MNLNELMAAPGRAAFLEDLVRNSPMTAVLVHESGEICEVLNGELLGKLGYPWPDEVKGKQVHILVPEDRREQHKIWFSEWMKNPVDRPLATGRPFRAVASNGDLVDVDIRLSKRYYDDGAPIAPKWAGKSFRGAVAFVMVKQ